MTYKRHTIFFLAYKRLLLAYKTFFGLKKLLLAYFFYWPTKDTQRLSFFPEKCVFSLKNRIVRPRKIATYWPTKDNLLCVTPNDCRRQPLVFKQVKTFLAPLNLIAPHQTSGSGP